MYRDAKQIYLYGKWCVRKWYYVIREVKLDGTLDLYDKQALT